MRSNGMNDPTHALTVDAIIALLVSDYSLEPPVSCRLLHDGFNTHYLITTSTGDAVLRIYRDGWRTADDIAYELAVLTHLAARGVPVCEPIARRNGAVQSLLTTGQSLRTVALFRCAAGQPPDARNSKVLRLWGRTMALIHQHTDDFTCPHQRFHLDLDHLIEQPLRIMLPLLACPPADAAFVREVARALRAGLSAQSADLDWGYCHGDFAGNAHQAADGALRVFDFDCGGPGWRAYDLAVCRLYSDIGGFWEEFRAGYEALRPISAVTLAAIPWFLVVRQFWRIGLFAAHKQRMTGTPVNDDFLDQHLGILRERIRTQVPELIGDLS